MCNRYTQLQFTVNGKHVNKTIYGIIYYFTLLPTSIFNNEL